MRRHSWVCFLLIAVAFVGAGCRGEVPIPQPTETDANEIGDVSRDLDGVASGDRQAIQDLADDLGTLGDLETGAPRAPEMASRLRAAIAERRLSDEQGLQLATHMFVAFSAGELSEAQLTSLQNDVRTLLQQIGAPPDRIQPVVDQVAAVQAQVKVPRRWWQLY